MAKYLKPRRGSTASAKSQNMLLFKGELFLDFPNGNIGKEPGRMVIGDGLTSYTHIGDDSGSSTNTFAPMIVHPAIYTPVFADSTPSTSSWTFDAGTGEINNIGNGTGNVTLPNIIGNIKSALCKHADSLNRLNQDLHYAKYIDVNAEADLNDFTDHGYYVFARNSTPANCPDDWTAADPFILQVIKDENAKDSRVDRDIYCQQIIYYGDDTYTRTAKWYNVTEGTTIFRLEWSEWHCNTLREEVAGSGIDGIWSILNVGSNTKIGFCTDKLTGKTITSAPTEFIIASPKITGYKPAFHQCTAYIVGDNTSKLGYSAMDRHTGAIDSYISGTPGTNKTIVVDNMVVYTKVYS